MISNNLQISLRITEKCNRDCQYCHYHSNKEYKYEDIIKIIEIIQTYHHLNKNILYYFHGGEPFMHKKLIEIVQYIKKFKNTKIEIQTNLDFISKAEEIIDLIDFFSISFHYPIHRLKEKINFILKNKNKINNIDLIYVPNFKEIFFIRKILEKNKINSEFTYNFFESFSYQKEFMKDLKKYSINLTDIEIEKNKFFLNKINSKNYLCDNSKYCIINGNGDVFRCSKALTYNHIACNLLKDKNCLRNVLKKNICPYNTCGYEKFYIDKI